MKNFSKFLLASIILSFSAAANAQVLITLIFGDALNTEKIEFGLTGGMNTSFILDIEESKPLNNFNLGFYFHIHMFENSFLSTGVLVKSNVGAKGMDPYTIGEPDFDSVFQHSALTKKIPVFYIPILFHQRFNQRWYIEAGPQLGLIHQPSDIFKVSEFDGNISYETEVRDEYKYLDAGVYGGIGYKLTQERKSISLGMGYYYGFVNVSKNPDYKIKNSSIYFFVRIPIIPGKKRKNE